MRPQSSPHLGLSSSDPFRRPPVIVGPSRYRRPPVAQNRQRTGPPREPSASELARLLDRVLLLAGCRPDQQDIEDAEAQVDSFFDRPGHYNPEAARVVKRVLITTLRDGGRVA